MIIEEIELNNVGRFEHLYEKTDAGVVGTMGPNAAGKTTLQTMLKYAFDGELVDDAESYVRGWGKEGMPSNGSVRIVFRKHGARGQIFRQFGKSPKRWLEWGDNVGKTRWTKAADVDRVIGEIFGADRRSISKAVFVPQGAFDKLFFGKPAEREALMVDMLVLTRLEKIEHIFDGKIKQLGAGIQDLAQELESATRRRDLAETRYAYLDGELKKFRDWSKDLAALRDHNQTQGEANSADEQVRYHRAQLRDILTRTEQMLAQPAGGYPNFPHMLELRQRLNQQRRNLEPLIEKEQKVIANKTRLEHIASTKKRLSALGCEIQELVDTMAQLEATAAARPQPFLTRIQELRSWQQASAEQDAAMAEMIRAGQALSDFDANNPVPNAVAVAEYQYQIQDLIRDHTELNLKYQLRRKVDSETHTCPVCEQPFDPALVSPASVEALAAQIETIKQKGEELRKKQTDLQAELKRWNETRARLAGESGSAGIRFQKAAYACGRRPEGDVVELEKQVQSIRDAVMAYKVADTRNKAACAELTQVQTELSKFSEDDIQASEKQVNMDTAVNKAGLNVRDQKAKIAELEARESQAAPLEREYNSTFKVIEENTKILETKTLAAVAMREAFDKELKRHLQEGYSIEDLEEKVDRRAQMSGEVRQAKEQADTIRAEQVDLEKRADVDGKKRRLVEDLRKLKSTFQRQGLPMRFVRHKFEKLAQLTRLNLMKQEANFTVEVDPDNSVSFTFTMLGVDDPYIMSQTKLSGGQKVRLSIAFLMAIQQLVIPEVAFLVLDEPSLHLDDEAKENLRDMLSNMGSELNNSQAQIWVCDHSSVLQSCYGKTIHLHRQVE
jgi:DNA repair protein SbcC/Rad50